MLENSCFKIVHYQRGHLKNRKYFELNDNEKTHQNVCGTVKAMLIYIVLHTYIRKEERTSIDTPSFHLDKQQQKKQMDAK